MYKDLKFALIFGDSKVDREELDGQIDKVYIDDEATHIEYVIHYLKTHLKEDQFLQNISISISPHQVAIYLKNLGHITFYNTTSYIGDAPNKAGRNGLLILPDKLTDKQLEALISFKEDLKDYQTLNVWSNFYRDENGFLNCNIQSNLTTNISVSDFIDTLVKQNKNINVRK